VTLLNASQIDSDSYIDRILCQGEELDRMSSRRTIGSLSVHPGVEFPISDTRARTLTA
jgi:hypothetical protein